MRARGKGPLAPDTVSTIGSMQRELSTQRRFRDLLAVSPPQGLALALLPLQQCFASKQLAAPVAC